MGSGLNAGVRLGLSVAVLLVAARASAQPRMPQYVACVGDSITAGVGASTPEMAYPAQLRALFGGAAVVVSVAVAVSA